MQRRAEPGAPVSQERAAHGDRRRAVGALAAMALAPMMRDAAAQPAAGGWQPSRPIDYIVPAGPGAALDTAARQMKEMLERRKLLAQPMLVTNRPGGAGTIAINALLAQPGNGHLLTTYTHSMLNNRLLGEIKVSWQDLTPIALLFEESIVVAVRSESPIADARALVARLKADPSSLSIGIATSVGNHIHVAIARPLQAAGVDVAKLNVVPFKSSAESMTAMLGGHIDLVSASTPNVTTQLAAGRLRVLATASAERLDGVLAQVPTWRDLGVDADYSSVQGVLAPPGLPPEAVAFWVGALRALSASDEWRQFLARNNWRPRFMEPAAMGRYLDNETTLARKLLGDIGLQVR